MQIKISSKSGKVNDDLRKYAERKLQKLDKYFNHLRLIQVTHSQERNWHVVEVTVHGDGILLRGEEKSSDLRSSVDTVVEKLERQLKKHKDRLVERRRRASSRAQVVPTVEEATESEESQPQIVKTKRFAIKPMTPEEATLQMELLDHDFFVFANAQTQQVNVVYRRKDGNYGLIEPEF